MGIVGAFGGSRSEALRRLQTSTWAAPLDDDGGALYADSTEVFCNLPNPPAAWGDSKAKLDFKMSAKERDFLRQKLSLLPRPGGIAPSLLARLVEARCWETPCLKQWKEYTVGPTE